MLINLLNIINFNVLVEIVLSYLVYLKILYFIFECSKVDLVYLNFGSFR